MAGQFLLLIPMIALALFMELQSFSPKDLRRGLSSSPNDEYLDANVNPQIYDGVEMTETYTYHSFDDKTLCIAATGAARQNIVMKTCDKSDPAQQWRGKSLNHGSIGLVNVGTGKCFDWQTGNGEMGYLSEQNLCNSRGNRQGISFSGFYVDSSTQRNYMRLKNGENCFKSQGKDRPLTFANCGDEGTGFYWT